MGQDRELRRLARLESLGRRVLGRLALRWCQTRAHSKLGLARLGDYTRSHFGLSRSAFSELAKIEKQLATLPRLAHGFDSGRITWSKLEILVAMAAPETEAALAEIAEQATVRQLEAALRNLKARCVDAKAGGRLDAETRPCVDAGPAGCSGAGLSGCVDATSGSCVDPHASCRVDRGASPCVDTGAGAGGCVDSASAAEEPWASFSRRVKPQVGAKFEQAIEHCRKTAGEHLARWRAVDWIAADFLSGVRMQGSEWSDRLETYNWKQGLHPAELPNAASPLPPDPQGLQGEGPGVREGEDESFYDFARRDLEETSANWKALDWSIPDSELPFEIAALAEELEQTTPHDLHERILKVIHFLQQIESEMAPLSRRFHAAGGTHGLAFFDYRHYLEQRAGLPARAFWRFAQHNRWARLSPALKEAFAQGAIHREHAKEIARTVGVLPEQPWIERAGETHLPRFEHELTQALCGRLEALDRSSAIHLIWFRAPESVVWHWMAALTEARYLAPLGACPVELVLDRFLQQPTEKIRREHRVFDRDGWRCQAPNCFSRRNLQAHHVVFRSRGGGDEQDNLTTICWSCHLHGVHEGRIKVTGEAPDGLSWSVGCRSSGPPLRVYA
ncbi:MAG TPA: HNH endonuclease signature motif containing protein [Acidobacteriota bacterium]